MLVKDIMNNHPIAVIGDMFVPDAIRLLKENNIHILPVLDKNQKLIGVATELDLHKAEPSEATTLSIWEITDLLSKIKVSEVMKKRKIFIEEKLSGTPVVRDDKLVGVVTKTDLFKTLLNMFGGRNSGVRVTLACSSDKGVIAQISQKIFELGGNIIGLSAVVFDNDPNYSCRVTIKVNDVEKNKLTQALATTNFKLIDIRET